jgi:hypothetical protein
MAVVSQYCVVWQAFKLQGPDHQSMRASRGEVVLEFLYQPSIESADGEASASGERLSLAGDRQSIDIDWEIVEAEPGSPADTQPGISKSPPGGVHGENGCGRLAR